MRKRDFVPGKCAAFTLIELLVVIAIIAILICSSKQKEPSLLKPPYSESLGHLKMSQFLMYGADAIGNDPTPL